VINDDLVVMHLQGSTQWDSLCHVGAYFDADDDGQPEIVYYNGFRAGEHIDASIDPADCGMSSTATTTTTYVRALGIDNMAFAGVQGRGVMVELAAHFGAQPVRVGWVHQPMGWPPCELFLSVRKSTSPVVHLRPS
jgi:hypothetical protein